MHLTFYYQMQGGFFFFCTGTEISTEADQRMDVLDLTELKKNTYAKKYSF